MYLKPGRACTLIYVQINNKLLLGYKKRGFAEGFLTFF